MDTARLRCSGPSRKLIVTLNTEATFSGAAYAFLDPGGILIIQSLTGVPAGNTGVGPGNLLPGFGYPQKDG